ncbi:MAG: DUF2959 family protein [Verrucomicrobia bacterium TMED71]|uniref:hypothetical protein n=1 Tax=Candidatus Pelagisphaera phototrophica TaxID=2684113 RepID=UPI000FEEF864|nr:hypothetical protein [Candidatus Pelagisphaera phototrophica]QXD32776.1 DUF2959 domain-containing protein [Candidatus Pelagisphaera phototrophica]RPF77275.1 MAG: DUF2959 family protein [Verrucomicrobia bacterium TMED71]
MKHLCFVSQASLLLFVVALLSETGCQSIYCGAMEKMGTHKRDILVERVEEGKEA